MKRIIGFITLAILLVVYLTTLQTIPNGSEHYYMIDVGETQSVLNQWGTLHATGYPLYVMVGNVLVAGLRVLGVSAATAPGVTSLIYGMIALGLIYVLAAHVIEPSRDTVVSQTLPYEEMIGEPSPPTPLPQGEGNIEKGFLQAHQHELLTGGMVLAFGLTRTVWVHNSIAEVYSFGLMILAGLFLIALWREPIRGRVYWLALLGGIGAFHHRAIAMAAPALVIAVWGEIVATRTSPPIPHVGYLAASSVRRQPASKEGEQKFLESRYWPIVRRVTICLVLGLLGFVQYLYLPLRANAGAKWVYGEPGTWNGFWDQFLGREASRFIGAPTTNAGLMANFNLVNSVLVTDVTLAGLVLGLAGLLLALGNPARRKVAITMLMSGGVAYLFHVLFYTDILSALILPVTLALAFGWLLLAEWVLKSRNAIEPPRRQERQDQYKDFLPQRHRELGETESVWVQSATRISLLISGGIFAGYLVVQNFPFVREMTTNPTGLETIELAKGAPDGSVLMLDWGPRYYAVAFAQDMVGDLPNVTLVTHKADFKALVNEDGRELVTADFTFYNRPVSWWEDQLGEPVYLRAVAPHVIAIGTVPVLAADSGTDMMKVRQQSVVCNANTIELRVDWLALHKPDHDLSVFVHLLDQSGTLIGQADEAAPVYGWRPLTSWQAGEVVHDVYALPRLPNADSIRYGLYRQLSSGEFQNEYTYSAAVKCEQ